MNFVVGSGPAGVSAAKGLLDRGYAVTLLDAGIEIEEGRKEALLEAHHPKTTPRQSHSPRRIHSGS